MMPGPSATFHLSTAALLRRRATEIVVILALLGYGVFLGTKGCIAPSGADSSGYFNMARLLMEGRAYDMPREIEELPIQALPPFTYCPLGFVPTVKEGQLTPTYPIGLPLLLGLSVLVAGWTAGPQALFVLHAIAGVVLTYLLARRAGIGVPAAMLGAAALALSPLHLLFSMQTMSDVPALTWCAAALWFALRGGNSAAFTSGVCMGMSVLIRPANALMLIPMLIALGPIPRRWLWLALGGLPFAIGLGWFNHAVYGDAFMTGYGSVSQYFGTDWAIASLRNYALWLPVSFSPLVLCALASPWMRPLESRVWWTHASWVFLVFGFYVFYYFTHREWWYLRFLLPAIPSLIVLATTTAEKFVMGLARIPVRRTVVPLAALMLVFNSVYWWRKLDMGNTGPSVRVYGDLQTLVRENVPARGVVLTMEASGALFFSLPHTLVRWDAIDDAWPRVQEAAQRAKRPIYAALFTFEDEQQFRTKTPGNWHKIAQKGYSTLWLREPPP